MNITCGLDAMQAGEHVRCLLRLENRSDGAITFDRARGDDAQVSILRNGVEIWRRTAGLTTGTGGTALVPPGETKTWEFVWSEPLFGTYTATGRIRIADFEAETETALVVTKGARQSR